MYILDPKKIKMERNEKRWINLTRQDGKTFKRVSFILLFPFTDLENYISVAVRKGMEYQEIGIIEHLKDLPFKFQHIIKDDLIIRYFVPEIKDIKKITTKNWFHEFDVITDRGHKKFFLRNVRENLRFKADSSIVITDMEKCRYKITQYDLLSPLARKELDKILL